MIRKDLNFFYALALKEGEGLGTAYEYLVKTGLTKRLFKKNEKPKNILIAGLPEKYGYGLDLLFLASSHNCVIDIVDERDDIIRNFNRILKDLAESSLLIPDNIKIKRVERLEDINLNKHYEFGYSLAVLQRIKEESRIRYLKKLSENVKYIILFAPNKENRAHNEQTGLVGLGTEDLLRYVKEVGKEMFVLDSGKIDLPPFSPGIKISAQTKNLIKNKKIGKLVTKFLDSWACLESFLPKFVKNKFAHMVYLVVKLKND